MKGFPFFVTGCSRCPYQDSDRDGDSYCGAFDVDPAVTRRLIQENAQSLTPSCPQYETAVEETPDGT